MYSSRWKRKSGTSAYEPAAQPPDEFDRLGPVLDRQRLGEQVVAAPPSPVRGELRVAREVDHERPDDRPVPSQYGFYRHGFVVDPLHHLRLLADNAVGVGGPVWFRGDKEGGLPGVAVRSLHDEVGAEFRIGCGTDQRVPRVDLCEQDRKSTRLN